MTTPTGGSSASPAACEKASRTADSSERSALTTRRVGVPNVAVNSLATASESAPSASTNQLPSGGVDALTSTGSVDPLGVEDLLRQGHWYGAALHALQVDTADLGSRSAPVVGDQDAAHDAGCPGISAVRADQFRAAPGATPTSPNTLILSKDTGR